MSANATEADKLYNPIGYTDFNKMCADNDLTPSTAVENKHYFKRTVNGVTEYYARLTSMVKRTYDDNVRTGTPVDSTDAVPLDFFRQYSFLNAKIGAYEVPMVGSSGQVHSMKQKSNATTASTFVVRDSVGRAWGETTEELIGTMKDCNKILVNIGYLNNELKEYAQVGDVQKTVADTIAEHLADAPEDFNTLKEMSDWISDHSGSAAEMNSAIQANSAALENKADNNHTHTEYASSEHNHDGVYAKTSDIPSIPTSLPASDVHAWAKAENPPTYTASEVGAVPTTRKVNNKELSGDITLSASDVGALPSTTKVGDLENDAGYVTMDDIQNGEFGGGEQGTPRATNYVFENPDRFDVWWNSEDRPNLVRGDAFYIGNVPWIDDTEKAFPDYIWDGTALKETIMPFAKLPLPEWLDEGDGTMKKGLSLLDIGNMPIWLSELTVVFDKGGSFKDYYTFELSVDDIVAKKNYATKGEIPTTLPASDVYAWAKAENKPEYNYSEIKNPPTIPTSLPASDVHAWAKAETKPTYNYSEIGAVNGTTFENYIKGLIDTELGVILNGEY
jgi:hypothetical protein